MNAPASRGPYRVEYRIGVSFEGPLHVGSGERLALRSDAPLLRDADGRPALPPSSVRGVLRDWCLREAGLLGVAVQQLARLFGATEIEAKELGLKGEDGDRQGRLRVEAVALQGDRVQIRDHVRIARSTGAAEANLKFDEEVAWPEAARFTLIYEGDGPDDGELALLRSALWALDQGLLGFGGRGGSGSGSVRLKTLDTVVTDRRDAEALSRWLDARRSPPAAPASTQRTPQPPPGPLGAPTSHKNLPRPWSWLSLTARICFDGPLLVGGRVELGDAAGREADKVYVQRDGTPTLPGSSLRGVVRTHAERIAHSLSRTGAALTLFGHALDHRANAERGARGLVQIGEGTLLGDPATIWMDHVAIDRVTQFAAQGRLFNARALASPTFRSRVLLRWHDREASHERAIALALIALRDLAAGELWLGGRTTRGYGRIASVTWSDVTLCAAEAPRRPRPLSLGSLADLAAEAPIKQIFATWEAGL